MIGKQRVNKASHKLTHILMQREIARQRRNWKKTRGYWNTLVRDAREELFAAWQAAGLEGDPMEQPSLGLPWTESEETLRQP